jgi:hypothetical protein
MEATMKRKLTRFSTGEDLEVEYDYSPHQPAVMYLSNGDPGYPEEPAEAAIYEALLNGVDILDTLSSDDIKDLEQQILDTESQLMLFEEGDL